MNEHEFENLARKLGAGLAERVDVDRIAVVVVAALRQPAPSPRVWWIRPAALRIAAAAVMLLGAGLVWRGIHPAPPAHPNHYIIEDLNGLSSDQLRDVLSNLDQTLQEGPDSPIEADLNDLSPEQLRAVLESIEG